MHRVTAITLLVASILFAGLSIPRVTAQTNTPTPYPTYTFYPTYTLYPTYTRYPTYTPAKPAGKPTITPTAGKIKATPTYLPTSESTDLGTRDKPVPIGTAVSLQINKEQYFDIGVTKVERGDVAWKDLKKANQFNNPPPDGKDYLMAYVVVHYTDGPKDKPLELDSGSFETVSDGQALNDFFIAVPPDPEFKVKFFPGANGGGWVVKQVFTDDANPLLEISSTLDSGGFFFSTTSN